MSDFDAATQTFLSWLPAASITTHPSLTIRRLHPTSPDRGVFTTTALPADTLLFTLPRTSTLTARTSTLPPSLLTRFTPWLQLVLVLLHEHATPTSKWQPYLALLPESLNTLMFWSAAELAELQASAVVDKIGRGDAEAEFRGVLETVREHPALFPGVPTDEKGFFAHAHRWASVIMAYSFDLEDAAAGAQEDSDDEEEGRYYKAMIPLADLLNADATRNNARLFQFPTHLEMRTVREVAAGEELLNDYGPLPRGDLLRRYGYTTPLYAQYDVCEVRMDMVVRAAGEGLEEAEVREKVEWLLEEGVLDDSVDFERGGEVPEEVVQVVKVIRQREGKRRVPSARMTDEVKEVVKRVLRERLAQYKTTVREDRELLAQGISGRLKDAVEVRLGEKEILWEALEKLGGGEKREAEEGEHQRETTKMRTE